MLAALFHVLSLAVEVLLKVFLVFIILALAVQFLDPYLHPLTVIVLYFLNISIYKAIPYSAVLFLKQVVIIGITLRVAIFFIGKKHAPHAGMSEEEYRAKVGYGIAGVDAPNAPGFNSRRIGL